MVTTHRTRCQLAAVLVCFVTARAFTQTTPAIPATQAQAEPASTAFDYEKREVMIPMRDGVKLHTVIVGPKGAPNTQPAQKAPILFTRTPYNASARATRSQSPSMLATLPQGDGVFVADGYIRVFQDVRGKYGSEGDYEIVRPIRGPLNSSDTDHSTDAYDSIDWLVKNVPECNGRVGMVGSSYEGFTVVMALINPHPALKVAAPMSPMVDGWMGDDWFHYGAFRQTSLDFFAGQCAGRSGGKAIVHASDDEYENFLRAGSAGDFAKAAGLEELQVWRTFLAHPSYDQYWKEQALDIIMGKQPLTVPTMWIQGIWDQEDMWGGIHCYDAVEPKDTTNAKNFLVMGPWRHSGVNYEGSTLGPLKFDGDTALQFRRDVLKPFFDQYLKEGAPKADTPPVFFYNTGDNHWDRLAHWPLSCAAGCASISKPLYLKSNFGLSFSPPVAVLRTGENAAATFDQYVSDPAAPVPYFPRPSRFSNTECWRTWLLSDQRDVGKRADVVSYTSEVLSEPVRVSGAPGVNLVASTTGTDSDWVVKLIDVYPSEFPSQPEMSGYELPVAMDIFRGRYRESFAIPMPIAANVPLTYRFNLSMVNHVFKPGHRIMVQVQSSWFPLYDRNPQTFVPNIFLAKSPEYVKATQRIYHAPGVESFIQLPIVSPN